MANFKRPNRNENVSWEAPKNLRNEASNSSYADNWWTVCLPPPHTSSSSQNSTGGLVHWSRQQCSQPKQLPRREVTEWMSFSSLHIQLPSISVCQQFIGSSCGSTRMSLPLHQRTLARSIITPHSKREWGVRVRVRIPHLPSQANIQHLDICAGVSLR